MRQYKPYSLGLRQQKFRRGYSPNLDGSEVDNKRKSHPSRIKIEKIINYMEQKRISTISSKVAGYVISIEAGNIRKVLRDSPRFKEETQDVFRLLK